jgi:hypothetical protein
MSTFGYYPKIDYWLFMSNGSIAVLLALAVGTPAFIFIWLRRPRRNRTDDPLPDHPSPSINENTEADLVIKDPAAVDVRAERATSRAPANSA